MKRGYFYVLSLAMVASTFTSFAAPRADAVLVEGWRFQPGDFTNAPDANFNDSDWASVSLPHCWGWEQAQRAEKYRRGPGWYRREPVTGAPQPDKRYFVRFEAAGSVADVYLNGEFLGGTSRGFRRILL